MANREPETHMEILKDIVYAPDHGIRGRLDVVLPDGGRDLPLEMVVHGGGMWSLSKERMHRVAEFVATRGWVAVNVNDGPDELHGIWCAQNDPQPRLLP